MSEEQYQVTYGQLNQIMQIMQRQTYNEEERVKLTFIIYYIYKYDVL